MAPFVEAVEWVPARLLALSFALVGNFSTTVVCWREQLMAGVSNARMIHSCALASLVGDETLPGARLSKGGSTAARSFDMGMEIESLHLLMRRTAVAWLILLAFGVLLFD
jgi:membrane protein required for beta-lactamase induction